MVSPAEVGVYYTDRSNARSSDASGDEIAAGRDRG